MEKIPEEILLNIKKFLYEKESNNLRIAYKYYSKITPINFDLTNLLFQIKKLKNGDKIVHFTDKETCSKVINYVKRNYNFSHLCCSGKGIMLKTDSQY